MLGRNDPWPCGSGKKYKKCCWAKDRAEQQAKRTVVNERPVTETIQNEFDETSLPPLVNQSEPVLFTEQQDAFWESFEDASYEERWPLLDDFLVNKPELFDGEIVFETANMLFAEAVERGDAERFSRLLDQFETLVPAVYQGELGYILDWRIQIELLPAWLRFLAMYGLRDEKTGRQMLKSLNYLKGSLLEIAQKHITAPLVAENLAGWPYEGLDEIP